MRRQRMSNRATCPRSICPSFIGVHDGAHVALMTMRTRVVDVAADREESFGILRLSRTDRGLTRIDKLPRPRHPLATILGARNYHQQVSGFSQRDRAVSDGDPF